MGLALPNLGKLNIGANYLEGVIPDSISNASQIYFLELGRNQFSGTIPDSLGNLALLELLDLEENKFINQSPSQELSFIKALTNCRYLRELDLYDNQLYGILPASIGNLSQSLELFIAGGNNIEGSIPTEIGNLSNLIKVLLFDNALDGIIPRTVKDIHKLQVLDLSNNKLQGPISGDICQLQNLGSLNLGNNRLSGPLPTCLGNISSLREIYLYSNGLAAGLPTSLWNLKDLLVLDFSSNSLSGSLAIEIVELKVAITIDLSKNEFFGNIPSTIEGLENLIKFSLAHNRLQGPIPESVGKMLSLQYLDLSENNLSGSIPKSLESLKYLKYLNISFNRLRGEIPSGGPFANFTKDSFVSNDALCGAPRFKVPACSHKKLKAKAIQLAIYILLPIILIVLALSVIYFLKRRQVKTGMTAHNDEFHSIRPGRISYFDLQRATDGFSESNLLGVGSYGSVYMGALTDGTVVAIKVFNLQFEGAFKSFDTECEILRNLRHRNLTKIISCCSNLDFKALVLEYMPQGSLEMWLYSENKFLDILQRLDIMIDVACALEYLHHGYSPAVVHCDLKPSNVLLDESMVAHVSDFGIGKFLNEEESIAQTKTIATLGYIAPEYGSEGLVSTKCDVYSYGIMLMEAFTRRKPSDEMFVGDLSLKCWVDISLPNDIVNIIDATLLKSNGGECTAVVECVSSMLKVALKCSSNQPDERMNMKDVRAALKRIKVQFLSASETP